MKLDTTPAVPALDTELHIRLTDVTPGATVTLVSSVPDPVGRLWSGEATFTAAGDGAVDLTRDAPATGSYSGVDPMGLVWSMSVCGSSSGSRPLTLTASVDSGDSVEASVERQRQPAGVTREVVSSGGLVGVLCYPEEGPARPGVVLVGGAEGGLHDVDAALLAAHGFTVLALAYFGAPGLPSGLVRVPLEYFGTAIDWLLAHERVTGSQVGMIGGSRGGEASLLVASTFERVGAVVSLVGSGVLTQGISYSSGALLDILRTDVPSWTWRDTPLPYLPYAIPPELESLVAAGEPVPLRLAFPTGDPGPLAENAIEVERIQGPVLLLSAEHDGGWDSAILSEVAVTRLDRACHPYPYEHVVYPGAGHAIAPPPYGPTTERVTPGPGVRFDSGGTPAATAAARADQWRRSIAWFAEHLGG
jgi:dienelactone hydrolase